MQKSYLFSSGRYLLGICHVPRGFHWLILGGEGCWWAPSRRPCPAKVLATVSGPGEEAPRLAISKQTITARLVGLFNTLLTGSPWQPGAGSSAGPIAQGEPSVLQAASLTSSRDGQPRGTGRDEHLGYEKSRRTPQANPFAGGTSAFMSPRQCTVRLPPWGWG